jgi:hypothetical protein
MIGTATLLANLEVPDCGCKLPASCDCKGPCDCPPDLWAPPCEHLQAFIDRIKRSGRFPLPVTLWLKLRQQAGEQITDPKRLPEPVVALSRAVRVAVYEQRAHEGLRLYHPKDLWRDCPDAFGLEVFTRRNGSVGDRWEEEEIAEHFASLDGWLPPWRRQA